MNSSDVQKLSIESVTPDFNTTLVCGAQRGLAHYLSHDQRTMDTSYCHTNRVDILLGINKNDRI